jgi:ankyrin repeat protein
MKFHHNLRLLSIDAIRGNEETFIPIRQWFQKMIGKPKTRYNQKCITAETKYCHPWDRRTPLHILLSKCCPIDIIELYLIVAPEVALMMDNDCMLPLHVTCYNYHDLVIPYANHSLELLDMLTKRHPETMLMNDRFGRSPAEIMRSDEWFQDTDNNGMTLLHHACQHNLSLPLLNFIVDGSSNCDKVADSYGRTPSILLKTSGLAEIKDECGKVMLHHVCNLHECNNDLLKLVLKAYLEALYMTDKYGLNPFHYACLNKYMSTTNLKCLIEFNPEIMISAAK